MRSHTATTVAPGASVHQETLLDENETAWHARAGRVADKLIGAATVCLVVAFLDAAAGNGVILRWALLGLCVTSGFGVLICVTALARLRRR